MAGSSSGEGTSHGEESMSLFIAGAVSGVSEAFAVQPLDMVKTRHQLNTGLNETVYSSLVNLYREGGMGHLYRGMTPELIGMVPKTSVLYATYELVRRELSGLYGDVSWVASVAGMCAAVPEAVIVTPSQVIKVRMQAREHLGRYKTPLDCLNKTIASEGFEAMFKGLGPTLLRNGIWNTVYFGTMHKLKSYVPKSESRVVSSLITLTTGFCGAVFATCFNAPFDVVKSRFQSQLPSTDRVLPKYRNSFQTLSLIIKEEGVGSIYKGFRAKALRMGVGGAVAMTTFEIVVTIMKWEEVGGVGDDVKRS